MTMKLDFWSPLSLAIVVHCSAAAAGPASPLDALVASYHEELVRHDNRNLYWRDGTVMSVDDGVLNKSFDQLLRNSSILDQFRLRYPIGQLTNPPARNFDPGRFRNEEFFKKLYGDCRASAFKQHLRLINWLPGSGRKLVEVTQLNGVADQLVKVSREIDSFPDRLRRAAYPIGGVLSCRPVADTGRMSMHGYAAAIDLNLEFSDYWLWDAKGNRDGTFQYKNKMPIEIIEIFERHGFIWGGRWYHYDTMHFEYRPELIRWAAR
jgi:D-alanyl-D-alanine carboxypeptidase